MAERPHRLPLAETLIYFPLSDIRLTRFFFVLQKSYIQRATLLYHIQFSTRLAAGGWRPLAYHDQRMDDHDCIRITHSATIMECMPSNEEHISCQLPYPATKAWYKYSSQNARSLRSERENGGFARLTMFQLASWEASKLAADSCSCSALASPFLYLSGLRRPGRDRKSLTLKSKRREMPRLISQP